MLRLKQPSLSHPRESAPHYEIEYSMSGVENEINKYTRCYITCCNTNYPLYETLKVEEG